jgi:hypothetical protein
VHRDRPAGGLRRLRRQDAVDQQLDRFREAITGRGMELFLVPSPPLKTQIKRVYAVKNSA